MHGRREAQSEDWKESVGGGIKNRLELPRRHRGSLKSDSELRSKKLVADRDSGWGGELLRPSVKGYPCGAQKVTMCNRSLKQTAISLSSGEAAREDERRSKEARGSGVEPRDQVQEENCRIKE